MSDPTTKAIIEWTIAQVLAPPQPTDRPDLCREPGCPRDAGCLACDTCGWHRPYCCCV